MSDLEGPSFGGRTSPPTIVKCGCGATIYQGDAHFCSSRPTNDPTAPRVVLDPASARCNACGDAFAEGDVHACPAPRVVGGGAQPCPKCEHPRAAHSSMGCLAARADRTACECLKTQAEIMSAAALPEEGTTPPRCKQTQNGTDWPCVLPANHIERHEYAAPEGTEEAGPPNGNGGGYWTRRADSLRETEAGRGEATFPLIDDSAPNGYLDRVGVPAFLREIARDGFAGQVTKREWEAIAGWAESRAASPEGGAPTEELTEIEWLAIQDAMEFTERHCGFVSDAHLRAKPKVASRLTRSPRAAGEPSDTEMLREALQELLDHHGCEDGDAACRFCEGAQGALNITAPPPERAP